MAVRCQTIIETIERLAPLNLAEDWDNPGLLIGDPRTEVQGILVALDLDSAIIEEARTRGANFILVHHPPVFRPLKNLRTDTPQGSLLQQLLKANLQVYAAHTNLDAAEAGVNDRLAKVLQLEDLAVLKPTTTENLYKLVVFVPESHEAQVRQAIGDAGAGWIGNYSHCTFRLPGTGTFKPLEGTDPYIGQTGRIEQVAEYRLETVMPQSKISPVINSMLQAHPYEEVAYDLFPLANQGKSFGLGRIGSLKEPLPFSDLIKYVKLQLGIAAVKVAVNTEVMVKRVAVCGGSGGSLIRQAAFKGAQALITGDVDYHRGQEALALGVGVIDAGHYTTERVVLPFLVDYLQQAFQLQSNLPVYLSQVNTDPWKIF